MAGTTKTATITEALAEYKTLGKRADAKRTFVRQNLLRIEAFKDPLGDSVAALSEARQGVTDMEEQMVAIRRAIAEVNQREQITVNGETRSIADWLVWRRDIAPAAQAFALSISSAIQMERQKRLAQGATVTSDVSKVSKPQDVVVNLDEKALAKQIEDYENVLGTLDGLLSLKNATLTVTY